jgi:hypothetical protein
VAYQNWLTGHTHSLLPKASKARPDDMESNKDYPNTNLEDSLEQLQLLGEADLTIGSTWPKLPTITQFPSAESIR